ncbi:MAG: response regulator transcription factor [Bacteroidota bacterium]
MRLPLPLRILIADDSSLVRQILSDRLGELADIEVVGEATDGIEAVDQTEAIRPEVVLLDLQMPRMSGLQALRAIREKVPEAHVVVLTNHADAVYRRTCLAAGAAQFLDKSGDLEALDDVIRGFAGNTNEA